MMKEPTAMSELPAVDSVWGVIGDTNGWRQVTGLCGGINFYRFGVETENTCYATEWQGWVEATGAVDITSIGDASADAVWDEVVEALQSAWPNETLHWNESPRELLTRLINERDDNAKCEAELVKSDAMLQRVQSALKELHAAIERGGLDISCCMDCGAPVVCIPDGLPMCDGCAANAVASGKGLPELTDAERATMNAMPANLVEQLWNKESLSQPHTAEWLCEIGGAAVEERGECVVVFADDEGLTYDVVRECWFYRGSPINVQPKTRGDVLKWLDVLGIATAYQGRAGGQK